MISLNLQTNASSHASYLHNPRMSKFQTWSVYILQITNEHAKQPNHVDIFSVVRKHINLQVTQHSFYLEPCINDAQSMVPNFMFI